MTEKESLCLNIGAGRTYIPDFINVDIDSKADVCLDLSEDRLPFEDNSVDLIFSYHALEHISDYLFALSEIYRVLKHGGKLLVGLPYVSLTEYHLVNPYHLHNFNEFSFDFFDPNKLKGSAVEQNSILFKKIFCRYHYMGGFKYVPYPLKVWCRRHLFNVVRKIDIGLLAIKDPEMHLDIPAKSRMVRQFDSCIRSRKHY